MILKASDFWVVLEAGRKICKKEEEIGSVGRFEPAIP